MLEPCSQVQRAMGGGAHHIGWQGAQLTLSRLENHTVAIHASEQCLCCITHSLPGKIQEQSAPIIIGRD